MSFSNKINPFSPSNGLRTYPALNGLDDFRNTLEKDFFAEVKIQSLSNAESKTTDLILEFYCNFGITESLHYFNNGSWGGFTPSKKNQSIESSLQIAFNGLRECNNTAVDIMEASIHFKDTSIIISRLYNFSISEQIGDIILKVSEHFVYFTKGLTEMPYEIFVPVFEDKKLNGLGPEDNHASSYFDFWGLYFENDAQHDVMVYNLDTKQLQKEDFFLLE